MLLFIVPVHPCRKGYACRAVGEPGDDNSGLVSEVGKLQRGGMPCPEQAAQDSGLQLSDAVQHY